MEALDMRTNTIFTGRSGNYIRSRTKSILELFCFIALLLFCMGFAHSFPEGGSPNADAPFNQHSGTSSESFNIAEQSQPQALSGKRILFLNESGTLASTEWNGHSDLLQMLNSAGAVAHEYLPEEITSFLIDGYDIVVFSLDWLYSGSREISYKEAQVLADFVNSGKGLLLLGEYGLDSWRENWNNSVNKVGAHFGIEVRKDMICDPDDHHFFLLTQMAGWIRL
jgi:hypothetical protein